LFEAYWKILFSARLVNIQFYSSLIGIAEILFLVNTFSFANFTHTRAISTTTITAKAAISATRAASMEKLLTHRRALMRLWQEKLFPQLPRSGKRCGKHKCHGNSGNHA